MKEMAAFLVLLRFDCDDAYCRCGEPWETGRAAVADLSGSDLLSFTIGEGKKDGIRYEFTTCPACNPVRDKTADILWDAYCRLNEIPAEDNPDDLLDMML